MLRAADQAGGQLPAAARRAAARGRARDRAARARARRASAGARRAAGVAARRARRARAPAPTRAAARRARARRSSRRSREAAGRRARSSSRRRSPRAGERCASTSSPSPSARARGHHHHHRARARRRRSPSIVKVVPLLACRATETRPAGSRSRSSCSPSDDASAVAAARCGIASPHPIARRRRAAPAEPSSPPATPPEERARRRPTPTTGGRSSASSVARLDDAHRAALGAGRHALPARRARSPRCAAQGADVARARARSSPSTARQLRDLRARSCARAWCRVARCSSACRCSCAACARATGKQVRLEIDAGDAELDKAVAERLLPRARPPGAQRGRPRASSRPRSARAPASPRRARCASPARERSSSQLELTVARRRPRHRRARAVARARRRAVPADDAELLELLCRARASRRATRRRTTSGRGMGMDIVRRIVVDELGGELDLRPRAGAGTTFTLRVPLTIAIVDAFSFECAARSASSCRSPWSRRSSSSTRRAHRARPARGAAGERCRSVERRGEAVPLVRARARCCGSAPREPRAAQGARGAARRRAGRVRRRPHARPAGGRRAAARGSAGARPGVAGATDLGDGRPTLVLDLRRARRARRSTASAAGGRRMSDAARGLQGRRRRVRRSPPTEVLQIESYTGATPVPGAPPTSPGSSRSAAGSCRSSTCARASACRPTEPTLDTRVVVGAVGRARGRPARRQRARGAAARRRAASSRRRDARRRRQRGLRQGRRAGRARGSCMLVDFREGHRRGASTMRLTNGDHGSSSVARSPSGPRRRAERSEVARCRRHRRGARRGWPQRERRRRGVASEVRAALEAVARRSTQPPSALTRSRSRRAVERDALEAASERTPRRCRRSPRRSRACARTPTRSRRPSRAPRRRSRRSRARSRASRANAEDLAAASEELLATRDRDQRRASPTSPARGEANAGDDRGGRRHHRGDGQGHRARSPPTRRRVGERVASVAAAVAGVGERPRRASPRDAAEMAARGRGDVGDRRGARALGPRASPSTRKRSRRPPRRRAAA